MQPTITWTGDRLILAGRIGRPRNQGLLAFDPAGEHWAEAGRLDSASQHGEQRVWTGRQLVQIGGQDAADEAISTVVDPSGGTGSVLPSLPGPRSHAGAVWTGTELLVWGGKPDTPMGSARRWPVDSVWRSRPSSVSFVLSRSIASTGGRVAQLVSRSQGVIVQSVS